MLIAVLMAGAVALGWLLASSTSDEAGAVKSADRRAKWIDRHPGEVEAEDVQEALLAAGLSRPDVALVAATADLTGVRPFTQWMFLQTYGARELALAVAGGMDHDTMLDSLSEGILPSFDELEATASEAGLETAAVRRHRVFDDLVA